ncbi:MAG: organic solvent tolerance protein OstA [Bacteroidetes bacterium]|nr:organic solvent tolerance protein OstA [Bacteroidota bacterium]HET6244516.1 OstA-like protein [Bacteroidia bacterium]
MKFTIHIILLFLPFCVFSQKVTKIELLGANSLEYDEKLGKNVRRLLGNVRFKHDDVLMNCDSAYLYSETNSLDAFSNIYINQGDTVHIYGDKLKYMGNSRKAEILNNVRLVDNDMTLTSNNLTYDMKKDIGFYTGGGKMVSAKNNNTLTSNIGYYYSKPKNFFFKDSVVLINPEYEIYSDTLKFNTVSEIAYFFGPTNIYSKENQIYCENGWYDTKNDLSKFKKNSFLLTSEQKLQGDSLYYDRKTGIGQVYSNVIITDTVNKFIINGDYAIHYEHKDQSTITGKPVLTMTFEKDSLFLHADTLFAEMDSTGVHRIVHAYHHSKFYKNDMQGVCDSLVYTLSDSTIRLYIQPVLWSTENQMTAEFISIKTADGKIDHMVMDVNAFIVSQEDTVKYFNQIKGKNIVASFHENALNKVKVTGNGETIYFTREDNGDLFGVNKAISSDLLIYMKENAIEKISFINKPEATLFPIEDVTATELELKDFQWREDQRPKTKEDIFVRNILPEIPVKKKVKTR